MKNHLNEVNEIPTNPSHGATFLIKSNGISDFTHGIFKYPCKFIPHIPRWFLEKYSNEKTRKYGVIDPFVGSGTTLVESSILGIPSYGIDIDPLSCLLSEVKTTGFTKTDIEEMEILLSKFKRKFKDNHISKKHLYKYIPGFTNLFYWFPQETIQDLAKIKYIIDSFYRENNNNKTRKFLLITLASIIRKVSFADEQSPKPYISKKIKKEIPSTIETFLFYLEKYFSSMIDFSERKSIASAKIIGYDARKIEKKALFRNKVHLAMTSPPYINAFDYVRSLRLENVWLDLISTKEISNLYNKHIGTERIPADRYKIKKPTSNIPLLNEKLAKIYEVDKKRAYVVADYFKAMYENIREIHTTLLKDGHYCIVIGNSKIKNVDIPTSRIFIKLANKLGFELVEDFSYIIRNRYLRIPRMGRGGFIPKDYVLVFKK